MPSIMDHPTLYPEIDALLSQLRSNVQSILGDTLVGMYVYGSLASGDFQPKRSDIDFLIVTKNALPLDILSHLEAMHTRLFHSHLKWAKKLEGSYIPQQALRRYDPADSNHPSLRVDGSFEIDHHGSNWVILCHLIREEAIILAGPDPKDLIEPISAKDLKRAARATLEEWWAPQLDQSTRLQTNEYRAYAILTMCRILFTLHKGSVVPKSEAARWSQEELNGRWKSLIQGALEWLQESQRINLNETVRFIRYTLELVKQSDDSASRADHE